MPPKRIRNNDFPTNLVPTEKKVSSHQPVVLLHVHMTPPLTSFNYWGKKYSIAQVENDICHFFKKKKD